MDKTDSDESHRQIDFGQRLPAFEGLTRDIETARDPAHESPEQIVATNVSQQLLSDAFGVQKLEKAAQESVPQSDTRADQMDEQYIEEQPIHENIEYHSEHRFSGQPIQQYIYDEEEEDEEEEDQEFDTEFIGRQPKDYEEVIASDVSPNTRTQAMDAFIEPQTTGSDEILYQLSDDNVLTAQTYGFGRDLRIDSHSDQPSGEVSVYELNNDDPFSTPHKQRAERNEIEESFERFVDSCEPFETIATDFGMSSAEEKNNLLDFNSPLISGTSEEPSIGLSVQSMSDLGSSQPNHALSERTGIERTEGSDVAPSSGESRHSDGAHTYRFEPTLTQTTQSSHQIEEQSTHPFTTTTTTASAQQEIQTIEESPIDPIVVEESPKQRTQRAMSAKTMPKQESEHAVTTAATECNCPFSPSAWFNPNQLNPTVAELVYWRDPKKSGVVFGAGLAILVSLTFFSIISVIAYTSLATLSVTLSFRIYKNILQAVQKTNEGHPFKEYLEIEITPSSERIHQIVDSVLSHLNCTVNKLRSVFLVEDIIDSLKFVVLFWCLTYIGSWFNGLTLIILAYLGLFSVPKVYEMNKTQIDQYLSLASTQITEITSKIRAKIPFPAKKEKDN